MTLVRTSNVGKEASNGVIKLTVTIVNGIHSLSH